MTDEKSSDAGGAAVWLLALGQTLVYAGCYYSFPALLPDLEAATGWSKAELALGPTLAFLIMAGLTPFTGRLVDRGLGGEMLIWLPGLCALGVAGLGLVGSLAGWLVLWAVIGVAQAGSLYETCFAFLTRRLGDGRAGGDHPGDSGRGLCRDAGLSAGALAGRPLWAGRAR